MVDIFQTSVSGLLAFQQALATTSHNINNVNTDGYSRQQIDFTSRQAHLYGGSYIGTGVNVASIRRLADAQRNDSVRVNTADFARLQTFAQLAGRIDSLMADKTAGLSPALQKFFDAAHQLANNPATPAARGVLLTEGANLASAFHFMDQRLSEISRDINSEITVQVEEINQFAQSIARINQEIAIAQGRAQGGQPNDLLDQRESLLRQLSERISTRVVEQADGQVNVFIGNGQGLVVGASASQLATTPNDYDPQRLEVAFNSNGTSINITSNLTGGSLGGVLDFRREMLDAVRNEVGQLATSVALQFNAQHRLGVQFDTGTAQAGADFFSIGSPQVLAHRAVNASGVPTVAIDGATVQNLKGSDYRLSYDAAGAQWVLTRLSDNTTTNIAPGDSAVVDGLSIDTSTIAIDPAPANGDSFLIRPTVWAAGSIKTLLTRPDQVAAANPVLAAEATDATGQATNTGTASIGAATVGTGTTVPLAGPITLTFRADFDHDGDPLTPGRPGFELSGIAGGFIEYDPDTQAGGAVLELPLGAGSISFEMSGIPREGDAFVLSPNLDSRGNNDNARFLAGLSDRKGMNGGESTFSEFYSSVVGQMGAMTLRANVSRDSQEVMLNQAVAFRDELSGVNVDEEVASLLRFQQAYQASAQVIGVANTLFQTLLGAVGR